ncbi:nucleotidyltransferase domain-containing protein [Actinoplanes sp. LDG1-06]|uniref:Nucleotidyltransferase domain-containing protein n=1 Tax=Paractinoplanes ovalisporus TaxID=2810368 RepID=A0ABS2AEJ7_9ACTN|nr:nucleotidyltransferase domain-containing protein [Actinoplanes ovalisporus]MBM2617661.1 nucleotidyltransferase domain-containing protein [Actinoplanes ovalisporus]
MPENERVQDEIDFTSPRGRLATRLSDVVGHRWPAEVQAIGVHGSLAHGDDHDSSDVNLVVLTYRPGHGPRPALRRVDGILVDLQVTTAEEGLRRARELTPRWPLEAERFVTSRPLHDPHGLFARQRDAHLGRLAEARPLEFSGLARHDWEIAAAAHARAVRLAEYYDTDAALVMMAEARLHAALVAGLLSRTYFRNQADAVKRTGLAGADVQELSKILDAQAEDLTARGRPVDGTLKEFLE